jgi:hypothetical protein
MNNHETRRYDSFTRVRAFGLNHSEDFLPASKAGGHFSNVARIIKELEAARLVQHANGLHSTEPLAERLRLMLQDLTRTARAIAQDEPGFADPFRPPENAGLSALLTAVDAILLKLLETADDTKAIKAAKAALIARFVQHEMPADFVTRIAADRAAINSARAAQESGENETVQSTAAVGRLVRDGTKEVIYLDAIVRNKYARNPDKLRAWMSASHVERPRRLSKKPSQASVSALIAGPLEQEVIS